MTNIPFLISANQKRWEPCEVAPSRVHEVEQVSARLVAPTAKAQYIALQNKTDVPWFVIATIHEREASQNFRLSLAQGDPWNQISTHIPRGRGPFRSWFDCGIDALVNCPPHAAKWRDWTPGGSLTLTELYNGTGYEDFHHEASPYLWGATNQQEWGKYVSDGHYDPHVWDTQLGTAAMFIGMMKLDSSIGFAAAPTPPPSEVYDTAWVQTQLNKWLATLSPPGTPLVVDGIMGSKTNTAIKAFQVSHGLTPDGIAGPLTKAELAKLDKP